MMGRSQSSGSGSATSGDNLPEAGASSYVPPPIPENQQETGAASSTSNTSTNTPQIASFSDDSALSGYVIVDDNNARQNNTAHAAARSTVKTQESSGSFSYNQIEEDVEAPPHHVQGTHHPAGSTHVHWDGNQARQNAEHEHEHEHDPHGLKRIGSTDSHRSHHSHHSARSAVTDVTDWTQMEKIYRESSVCTEAIDKNGLKDPLGFVIVCAVVLVGEMARGILYPTLWGFVQTLGGDTVTMGYSVAAFSAGRMLVSPFFGWMSVHWGYRVTLTIALSFLSAGAFLYAQTGLVGEGGSTTFLIFAQTVMGIGSGTLGVTRAYVAEVSPKKLRTRYLAYTALTRDAGFTVTPFIGSALIFYFRNEDRVIETPYFQWNMYTAPAYVLTLACVLNLFMVVFFLEHRRREVMPKLTRKVSARLKAEQGSARPAAVVQGEKEAFCGMQVIDVVLWAVVALNFISKGSLSTYETLGVKIADELYDIDSTTVGIVMGFCGVFGVIVLLCFARYSNYCTDTQLIIGGLLSSLIGIAVMTDYGLAPKTMGRFVAGFFFVFGIGFPVSDTAIVGLFSKVAGNKPQGTLQGMLAMSSAVARLVVPILSSYVSQYLNMTVLFITVNIILLISSALTFRYRWIIGVLSSSNR